MQLINSLDHAAHADAMIDWRQRAPMFQKHLGIMMRCCCCQVNGFAAAFEKAGDDVSYAAVSNFFSAVTSRHSFATGGNNDHEYWGPAGSMADAVLLVRRDIAMPSMHSDDTGPVRKNAAPEAPWLPLTSSVQAACPATWLHCEGTFSVHASAATAACSGVQQQHATETEETCTQYNMLKIARYLFRWTGAPAFADYYERAILNGVFRRGSQSCKGGLTESCRVLQRRRAAQARSQHGVASSAVWVFRYGARC